MSERDARDEVRRVGPAQVVEALLYAPIGFGAKVVTETPDRLRQFRSDLSAARFIGEMAVTRGAEQLRARQARTDERPATPEPSITRRAPVPEPPDEEPETDVVAPAVDELAIVDYDSVPAIDVVAQLADLDVDERAVIERYERANRGRRTILGKLQQLADSA